MSNSMQDTKAQRHDVERLLGPLSPDTLMAVIALSPTLREIEQAALWLTDEGESQPEPHQAHRTVLAIVELVAAEEDDQHDR